MKDHVPIKWEDREDQNGGIKEEDWNPINGGLSREQDSLKRAGQVRGDIMDSNSVLHQQREQSRRNKAEPGYLKKMEAINRQNSLVKQKSNKPFDSKLDELDSFWNKMSNLAVDDGAKRNRFPDLLGGLDRGRIKNSAVPVDDGAPRNLRRKGVQSPGGVGGSILGTFDQEAYLSAQRMKEGGGDKMKKFQFNQVLSDATPPDRFLRDYRNPV